MTFAMGLLIVLCVILLGLIAYIVRDQKQQERAMLEAIQQAEQSKGKAVRFMESFGDIAQKGGDPHE